MKKRRKISAKSGIQLPHSTLLSRIRIAHDFIAIMVRQRRWSHHQFIFVEGVDTNGGDTRYNSTVPYFRQYEFGWPVRLQLIQRRKHTLARLLGFLPVFCCFGTFTIIHCILYSRSLCGLFHVNSHFIVHIVVQFLFKTYSWITFHLKFRSVMQYWLYLFSWLLLIIILYLY